MSTPLPALTTHTPHKKHAQIIWVSAACLLLVGGGLWWKYGRTTTAKTTYQTSAATKGTLVVSVSPTGTMNSDNRIPVSAGVTGTVSAIYVKNGDTVKAGQRILHITLDQSGQLSAEKSYSSYLASKGNYTSSQQAVSAANSAVSTQTAAVSTAQSAYTAAVKAKAPSQELAAKKSALTAAQSKLSDAQNQLTNAKNNLTRASVDVKTSSLSYAQTTGDILAPVAGTLSDMALVKGMYLSGSSGSGAGAGSASTQIATIVTSTAPTATVSLAEADVPKVKEGQKATLTFDAISGKTFIGTVIGVNRTGSVSSGVTTYPMTVQLDSPEAEILPNMSVTASVITSTIDNVVMVPSAAVKTSSSGTSTVTLLVNGQPQATTVTLGDSSDTQTVITSGVKEGDTVVTATITASTNSNKSSGSSTSLFGGSSSLRLNGGSFSGGTAVRVPGQ